VIQRNAARTEITDETSGNFGIIMFPYHSKYQTARSDWRTFIRTSWQKCGVPTNFSCLTSNRQRTNKARSSAGARGRILPEPGIRGGLKLKNYILIACSRPLSSVAVIEQRRRTDWKTKTTVLSVGPNDDTIQCGRIYTSFGWT